VEEEGEIDLDVARGGLYTYKSRLECLQRPESFAEEVLQVFSGAEVTKSDRFLFLSESLGCFPSGSVY
jgi:hypothetical protein